MRATDRPHRQAHHRTLVRITALATLAVGGALAAPAAPAPASLATPSAGTVGPTNCPAAFPVSAVRQGMKATGWTTTHGVTPSPFAVTVLGVLKNGISSGIDMIVIKASSRAITAVGGTWQGMSGSPIYAHDGRLIGALSYGMSFGPSRTAGVTPAADMYKVLNFRAAGARAIAARVTLPPSMQRAVVTAGAASSRAAAGGMAPLGTPVSVAGVGPRQLSRLEQAATAGGGGPFTFYRGDAASARAADPSRARPGTPVAAAVSYGAFSYAGVGTVTAVCHGQLLAFGHPFLTLGTTTESAHLARVLFVQKETLGPPFIVANVGGLIGTVNQDRVVAIRARLGTAHPASLVVSDIGATTGLHRIARTRAPVTDWLPTVAANVAYGGMLSTLQSDSAGSAWLHWTVTGHRAHGKTWTYTRTDRTSAGMSIGFSVGDLLYYPLTSIVSNAFETVTVDKLSLTVRATDVQREYRLVGLKVLQGDSYVDVTPDLVVQAAPGEQIQLQARLEPFRGRGTAQTVDLSARVPADAGPGSGTLTVFGGADGGMSPDAGTAAGGPTSFDEVLAELRAVPRNDYLYAELSVPDALGLSTITSRHGSNVQRVVRGTITVPVEVPGAEPPPAG